MDDLDIVNFYLENGILLSPDSLQMAADGAIPLSTKFSVVTKDVLGIIQNKKFIDVDNFEKARVEKEKHKNSKMYDKFLSYLGEFSSSASFISSPKAEAVQRVKIHIKEASTITKTIEQAHEQSNKQSHNGQTEENVSDSKTAIIKDEKHQDTSSDISRQNVYQNLPDHSTRRSIEPKIDSTDESPSPSLPASIKDSMILSKERFMEEHRLKIISSYNTKSRKWSVQDFVNLYNARFKELEKILRQRSELQNLTSISRITAKKEKENVALIGVVYEKALTKTGNIIFTLEDPTGTVKVVVNKTKEIFKLAEEIQLDEVIGVTGMFDNIIFANSLYIPDIPLTKELKKSPDEGYFVVVSDTEPGSKLFMEKEFTKFLLWLSGEMGNEMQKEVASKVKYLFIGGDLVNGVGIYPNQEYDLNILDIKGQYKALAELLKKVPSHIPIIICPGNHDVGRISEPQPPLTTEYAEDLISMPNIISVSNPSIINIYAQPENNFNGFDVLFYHGYSFIYYSENVPAIRKAGGQKRPDLIMKYLLQRRHLAPSHTSTLYIPDPKKDPLVIDRIPDFLLSGHVHRAIVSNYRNITCINASCWTDQSEEQERRGLEAQPARAFIVNMKTREVKVMNFLSREEQEKEKEVMAKNAEQANPLPTANPS